MDNTFNLNLTKPKNWVDLTDKKIRDQYEEELKAKEESLARWANRIAREKNKGGVASEEALNGYDKAKESVQEIKKILDSVECFTDQGIEYTNAISTEPNFSIAEYCGRVRVDKNRLGFVVENYNDSTCVNVVTEGDDCESVDLRHFINRIKTESTDSIRFMEILDIKEFIYNDDKESIAQCVTSVHKKHFINAENKAVLDKLLNSKSAISVSFSTLTSAINNNLNGQAKKGAEIWTNKSGFAHLDNFSSDGYPLLKKNSDGEFVYLEKYIVREFDDEILPNTEEGYPLIIGDFKNVIKFGVIGETRHLNFGELWKAVVQDRQIDVEVPILTTNSNSAYINCFIPKSE